MWIIISLIILGVLLLVAEIILLPGLTVAGIGSVISFGVAVYLAFTRYGTAMGLIMIGSILVLSIVGIALSLRAKTWQRLSLNHQVEGTSQPLPEESVKIGEKGEAITRLAPIGKVVIGGNTYEAKAVGDIYVDPKTDVEIVGFENFTIIVKVTK